MTSSTFTIMVVDDEEFATLVKAFLERSGYECASFTDSLLALEHFGKNYDKIHLIITDLRIPKLNRVELANKIREFSKTVKILLITAFVIDEVLNSNDFRQAEIAEILQKPLASKNLDLELLKYFLFSDCDN